MKLLSVAIPCYNSAAYMEHCVETLLTGGDRVEIIIVDDGSVKDNTAEIGDRLAKEHEGIVKCVHQENGGHVEAVNRGLKNATGRYFNVVESDDWFNVEALRKVLNKLSEYDSDDHEIDALFSNYVYEKEGALHKHIVQYRDCLPVNREFTWDEIGHFKKGQYILMHSVIFRTKMLRECKLQLPKHTFYVDNLYVFVPLPYVKKMYYLDVDFYRYFIGRDDQSVNEKVMIGRIDQQTRVNRLMFDYFSDYVKSGKSNKKLDKYMYNYLEIISVVSSILTILEGSDEYLNKKKELWDYFRDKDPELYKKLRHSALGICMNFKSKLGFAIDKAGYAVARKIFNFN